MKKYLIALSLVLIFVFCQNVNANSIEYLEQGSLKLSSFISGTVSAHSKISQRQYDSSKYVTPKKIQGYIFLKNTLSTPLNYTEILKIDDKGVIYSFINISHDPYKVKNNRIEIERIIVNASSEDYEFQDYSGLIVKWILLK